MPIPAVMSGGIAAIVTVRMHSHCKKASMLRRFDSDRYVRIGRKNRFIALPSTETRVRLVPLFGAGSSFMELKATLCRGTTALGYIRTDSNNKYVSFLLAARRGTRYFR